MKTSQNNVFQNIAKFANFSDAIIIRPRHFRHKYNAILISAIGWSMKFRETKFHKISRKNSFRILRNFYDYFLKFCKVSFCELKQNFAKFREIFATKFRSLFDEAKKQCCGDRAGNSSIIFVILFYIMK
jgi:hypothetical protein